MAIQNTTNYKKMYLIRILLTSEVCRTLKATSNGIFQQLLTTAAASSLSTPVSTVQSDFPKKRIPEIQSDDNQELTASLA
mmetsp:Transcript_29580/g.60805  ORF Transcript_29580/g.60805 Transcript_29580/m.60805 type:complete len:80 (+) Transcript_29580:253-492(+)